MLIKQLSVFLENKSGRLTELTTILGQANINLSALSIAETSEFGIIRMVTSNPTKGLKILKENNFSVNLTDVICIKTLNQAGALSKYLQHLSDNNVDVEYMYAFSMGENAYVIIRTESLQKTIDILKNNDAKIVEPDELYNI